MTFPYNGDGIKPSGGFREPIPEGEYVLKVISAKEGKSKSGYPQVKVDFEVAHGDYVGKQVRFYYVTFMPKGNEGAGMAIHFLKCLGEPWEGPFEVNADNWLGKLVRANVVHEEYNGYTNNKIAAIDALKAEEVPF